MSILTDRFWSKVKEDETTGCWVWTAAHNSTGYGQWGVGGVSKSVHRLTYIDFIGPIPDGLTIDHLCRNKSCCNPGHLQAVTNAENIRRAAVLITHCIKGHPLAGENLRQRGNKRGCRTCDRNAAAASRERRRAERAAAGNPVRKYQRQTA